MANETQKVYNIADCMNANISYNWTKQINRDGGKSGHRTENNNAIIKATPLFLFALQQKDNTMTEARAILMDYCNLKHIAWNDAFMNFGIDAIPNVKADVTPLNSYISQLKTAIESAHKENRKVTQEQLSTVIKTQLKVPEPLQQKVFDGVKSLCDNVNLF